MNTTTKAMVAGLLWAACAFGCGADDAVDFELIPDPNINGEEEILRRVSSLTAIIDSPTGLYAAGSESDDGVMRIMNADADSDLELVVTIPFADRLPRVRFERASLADVPLDIRFLGTDEFGTVAEGRVRSVRFEEGIATVQMPFNIRPERLPPRVSEVYPPDGSRIVGCALHSVLVLFSKPIDPESVFADGAVAIDGVAPGLIRIPQTGLSAEFVFAEEISGLEEVRFTLQLSNTIVDLDGEALDQIAGEPDAQGYVSDFVLGCTPPTGDPPPPYCGEDGAMEGAPCLGAPRFVCVDDFCEPTGECGLARCEAGRVCDPSTSRCASDCRGYGDVDVCPAERPTCDAESGLCVR